MNSRLEVVVLTGVLLGMLVGTTYGEESFGKLYRIPITAEHPKAYHVKPGDLIQCTMESSVDENSRINNITVEITGKSIAFVARVDSTDGGKTVDKREKSVFLIPKEPGMSEVVLLPSSNTARFRPIRITFLVEE